MNITEAQTIWYPGIYAGRTDSEYTQLVADVSLVKLTELVQKRAQEDGEWTIDNGFVGKNESNMRQMMDFVSNENNIQQCVAHVIKEGLEDVRTVDWICRDLANASKHFHGSPAA
ncbi:MAG TPA: hypothetical protein VEO92_01950 [Candidatus Nitrosocosmicus sp.]|nr:hypothetical protein [Candidatus Nitrosocosmicus sp.]